MSDETGQLIDMAEARLRFASRVHERAERAWLVAAQEEADDEAEAQAARDRWLADLRTWPRALYAQLHAHIEARALSGSGSRWAKDVMRYRRNRRSESNGIYPNWLEWRLVHILRNLREATRSLGSARHASKSKQRGARRRLEGAQSDLLYFLWQNNVRQINYRKLRAFAELALGSLEEQLDQQLVALSGKLAELSDSLARGVYVQGHRRGQSYSEATRARKLSGLAGLRRRRDAAIDLRRAVHHIDRPLEGLFSLNLASYQLPMGHEAVDAG